MEPLLCGIAVAFVKNRIIALKERLNWLAGLQRAVNYKADERLYTELYRDEG